jgi:Tol biopolymer transport system component/DNA-binding winged helix-turn-helix (wHTH) protein
MKKPDGGGADLLYVFGPFLVDPVRRLLRHQGNVVVLAPKAFEVLLALIERRDRIVEKNELLRAVWPNAVVEENNLARHISTLRKVFQESITEHDYIVTVPGRGYRFVATLQELKPAEYLAEAGGSVAQSQTEDAAAARHPAEVSPSENVVIAGRRPSAASIGLVAGLLLVMSFTGTQAVLPRSGERPGMPHRKLWQLTFSPGVHSEPTWSPDGAWIAYSSDRGGKSHIWVQSTTEENPVRLTSAAENDWQPAWSPDSKYVAFRSERDGGGLYIVPSRGGAERRIADFGYRPQWSRDGSKILFSGALRGPDARSAELYIVELDGGPPRQVLSELLGKFQSFQASWYPEGQRVSVYGLRRGDAGPSMWTVSLSGRDAVQSEVSPTVAQHLKEADVTFTHFVWSAAGDALFFEGTSEDVKNVWRVTVDPSTLRWSAGPDRLTTGAELNDNISLSSDGTRIAFSLRTEKTRLWSMPFDAIAGRIGGPGAPLMDEGADAPYDVSADGTRLVYRAVRQGKQELWMRSFADGTDRLLLTSGSISAPRWSPDGSHLVYRRDQPGERPGLPIERVVAVMTANGTGERLLTKPHPMSMGEQLAPFDWSADGTQILSSCPTGQPATMGICLFSLAAEAKPGSVSTRMIASRAGFALYEAQFSPDGRWVCFNAVTSPGISTIYAVPASGGEWIAITGGLFWEDKPRWGPDGRTIYFTSTRAGFVNVWGRRFDPQRGTPVADPFAVTDFQTPSRMLLPQIRQLHIALVRNHLILPLKDVAASIWVLENVQQ